MKLLSESTYVAYFKFLLLLTAPDDFTSIEMSVTFSPEQTRATVTVDTIDDDFVEIEEDFLVSLSNPSSGLRVGEASNALLFLADNDSKFVVPTSFN